MPTWNVHPLFVHFPIAFLCLYSIMECLRLRLLQRQTYWFPIKAILLILGTIGGFVASSTGEMVEGFFRGTDLMPVLEMHSLFAGITMWVYTLLAMLYVIAWIQQGGVVQRSPLFVQKLWPKIAVIHRNLFIAPVLILLAIGGFLLMTIVGALGAVLVHGSNVDPAVSMIYKLFFPGQ